MTITITSSMLCDLCQGKFTYEACEAICEYFDMCAPDQSPRIGDICISFAEIPADWTDEYDDENLIAELNNGNVVVAQ